MGINQSKIYNKVNINDNLEIFWPLYYINTEEDIVTLKDIEICKLSFELIMNSKSSTFLNDKNIQKKYKNLPTYFADTFIARLFEVNPSFIPIFQSLHQIDNSFIFKMINILLTDVNNEPLFEQIINNLVVKHHKRGIKATDYSIMGDVLFFTLKYTLDNKFTSEVYYCWCKLYSRMLKLAIPEAILLEFNNNMPQVKRNKEYLTTLASSARINDNDNLELESQESSKSLSSLTQFNSMSLSVRNFFEL